MKADSLIFLEKLEDLFGEVDDILKVDTKNTNNPIYIFYFYNLPEEGMITSVTYGLSNVEHPSWIYGRPELIVTVKSNLKDWGFASGYFASEFRGEKSFSYGSFFLMDTPISEESSMSGFLTFAPAFLSKEDSKIELPSKTINLTGMYPIYKEEIPLIKEFGLEGFLTMDYYDLSNLGVYSVTRKKLGGNKDN